MFGHAPHGLNSIRFPKQHRQQFMSGSLYRAASNNAQVNMFSVFFNRFEQVLDFTSKRSWSVDAKPSVSSEPFLFEIACVFVLGDRCDLSDVRSIIILLGVRTLLGARI